MFHILGFLFLIILVVLLLGIGLVGSLLRVLFGRRGRSASPGGGSSRHTHASEGGHVSQSSPRKKFFDDDEGEYVEFEDVKD